MYPNINSGIGSIIARAIVQHQVTGEVFIVGKAGLACLNDMQNIFPAVNPSGSRGYHTTVDSAINSCVANRGDLILVLPGHTEAVTATSINLDVAGVTVVGLGKGLARPAFTFEAAASTINVAGANCAWMNMHHIGNFDNVASAFTLAAAKDFVLENNTFVETSAALHFLSIVVTSATDNEADGLVVRGNKWNAKALAPNAFISILAAEERVLIEDNDVFMLATNDVGHFLTLAAKIVTNIVVRNNVCVVTGATNATVGIFLTGSGSTSTGIVEGNRVASLDTTSELISTASTGLKFFENYYTGTADASGKLWPVVDVA